MVKLSKPKLESVNRANLIRSLLSVKAILIDLLLTPITLIIYRYYFTAIVIAFRKADRSRKAENFVHPDDELCNSLAL